MFWEQFVRSKRSLNQDDKPYQYKRLENKEYSSMNCVSVTHAMLTSDDPHTAILAQLINNQTPGSILRPSYSFLIK
jgi:hypothetical protein